MGNLTKAGIVGHLPFVVWNETPPSGDDLNHEYIDYWNPALTGRPLVDRLRGRMSAALLVLTMQKFDAPVLLGRVEKAAIRKGANDEFSRGFEEELGAIIASLPEEKLPFLAVPFPQIDVAREDPETILLKIPFVERDAEGNFTFCPGHADTGDIEQDHATGRYIGASICWAIKRTGWTDLFWHINQFYVCHGETEQIFVGGHHAIAEALLAAGQSATPFLRSMSELVGAGVPAFDPELEAKVPERVTRRAETT